MKGLLWDHPPHNPGKWITDVSGIGRYLIQRREPRSREFVLLLNGFSTKYYGTVDELKRTVQRIIDSRGSVECPVCRWGFYPGVLHQHMREKHL